MQDEPDFGVRREDASMVEAASVLTLADIHFDDAAALLHRFGLSLQRVADGAPIPGSYWGECEAGIIGNAVHARSDTPVHSLLHEAGHLIVLPPERREAVHTDATDSIPEEDAVCVLQGLLGDALPGVGRDRVLADMDRVGLHLPAGFRARLCRPRCRRCVGVAASTRTGRRSAHPAPPAYPLAKRVAGSAAPGLSGRGSASGRMLAEPASAV
jgi:hypothetical protein